MPDVRVNTNTMRQYAERIGSINKRLTRLDWRLKKLYSQVQIVDLLQLMKADAMTGNNWKLQRCRNYLNEVATEYEALEKKLLQLEPLNFKNSLIRLQIRTFIESQIPFWPQHIKSWNEMLREKMLHTIIGIPESALDWLSEDGQKSFWAGEWVKSNHWAVLDTDPDNDDLFARLLVATGTVSVLPGYGEYKDKSLLGDEDVFNVNVKQNKTDYYQKNEDEDFYSAKGKILEGKAEAKIEGSVVDLKAAGEGEYAEGSAELKVLTAEAHAGVSGGLYVYTKDKDGKTVKMFSPGVSAEVGTSVAVVQADAEGRIGLGENKNMLGVYGNASASALSAEAEAKVAINRKEIYAGASAEADLVKVSGTGGVSVLGTDVGVNGSLKVGVGAHAEAGYTDGKLKVDVGVAAGVGFDLGFEVDVSGTIDAVSGWASDMWDGAQDTLSDIGDFFTGWW
ncbi:MAG: hypothetical protein IJM90_05160 [Firmicutes bacterium]|nr:hypothetical protein [Bacillota bacterium]